MTETRDWLPVGAAAHRNVRARIAKAVAAWSEHWFMRRSFAPLRYQERPRGFDAGGGLRQWTRYRGAAAIRCSTTSTTSLMEAALSMRMSGLELSVPDIQLLDAFARAILGDLARRLEEELDIEATDRDQPDQTAAPFLLDGGVEISLSEGQGPEILYIGLPMQTLIPACREALPQPARRPPLDRLQQALGSTPVRVRATLGHAQLGLQDIAGLAVGDVVVLGAGLDQAVDLSLSDRDCVFTHARLTDVDGEMALAFHDH